MRAGCSNRELNGIKATSVSGRMWALVTELLASTICPCGYCIAMLHNYALPCEEPILPPRPAETGNKQLLWFGPILSIDFVPAQYFAN